jgi:hypothetical protein
LSTEFGPERCCQPDRGPHCRRRTSDRPFHPATPAGEHCFTLLLALVLRFSGNWVGCGRGGRTVSNTPPRRREEWAVVRKDATFFTHGMRAVRRRIHANTNGSKGWPNQQYHVAVYRQGRYDAARGDRCGGRGWRGMLPTNKNVPSASQKSQEKMKKLESCIKKTAGNGPREHMTNHQKP